MKDRDFRQFALPFVYGLATANFVAITQFISAPQVQGNFTLLKKGVVPIGLFGMTLMTASVPLLLGYALYSEMALRTKSNVELGNSAIVTVITGGILGLTFTLSSFHRAFGLSFFCAFVIAGVIFAFKMNRLNGK
jgi:hypothetical protein